MKLFLVLFTCAFILSSCDDGDLTVDNLDFEAASSQRCGNIIYKLTETEALIIEIPEETSFVNEPTLPGVPRLVEINATNRVVYRAYNGPVASANICATIQPATPVVTEEWNATSGTIEITTTAVKTQNTVLIGGEKISSYRHSIIFRNITFAKPNGVQVYESFVFGDYSKPATSLPFNFDDTVEKCAASNIVFNYVGSESLTLDIAPELLVNEITPLGQPRIALITSTLNKLTYTLYTSGPLSSDYFCTTPIPSLPTISQQWVGVDGVEGISGIIEVSTTTNGTGFLHEIHLKKVTLIKGNSDFLLADDYLFGQLIVN